MIKGDIGAIHALGLRGGAEQQAVALLDGQRAVAADGADADFGAGEVLKDGNRRFVQDFQFPNGLDEIDEGGTVTVREVETENAHAGYNQFGKHVPFVGGGADGCENFGFHGTESLVPSGKEAAAKAGQG